MKFLIFYKNIKQVGGAEYFLFDFALSLNKIHEVKIVCFDFNVSVYKDYPEIEKLIFKISDGNTIIKLFELRKLMNLSDFSLIHSGIKDAYISSLFSKIKFIHFLHHPYFNTLDHFDLLSIFHLKNRKQFILNIESKKFYEKLLLKSKGYSIIKINVHALINILSIKKAHNIIVLSEYSKNEKEKYFNVKSSYIPPAISDNYLKYINHPINRKKENYILYFGRLTQEKRVDLVIKAFEKSNLKDFELIIIGKGDDSFRLKKIADSCNKKIKFLGFQNHENLIKYINAAKFTISLQWADYNLTVYESISLGTRVIFGKTFDVEPFDQPLIKNNMLFYVEPNLNKVSKMIEKVSQLEDVKHIDYAYLKKYTWDWYAKEFLKSL